MTKQEFINHEKASQDIVKVKCVYIDMAGDLTSGVLLSQIVYWHLPDSKGNPTKLRVEKQGELWLAKKREDWWDECRLTPRQFDYSISKLEDKELVKSKLFKFDGVPVKHVRIFWEQFLPVHNAIVNHSADSVKFEGGKWTLTNCQNGLSQIVKMDINNLSKSLTENTNIEYKQKINNNLSDYCETQELDNNTLTVENDSQIANGVSETTEEQTTDFMELMTTYKNLSSEGSARAVNGIICAIMKHLGITAKTEKALYSIVGKAKKIGFDALFALLWRMGGMKESGKLDKPNEYLHACLHGITKGKKTKDKSVDYEAIDESLYL